jgi:PIN domain nuclease of toxin-antitoxin system
VSSVVLDASAVLVFLHGEPGSPRVFDFLSSGDCLISAVNLSEVVARLSDRGGSDTAITGILDDLQVSVRPFDESDAKFAGLLRRTTGSAGLSLGDRACLALARRLGLPAVTADRAWADIRMGVDIEVVR